MGSKERSKRRCLGRRRRKKYTGEDGAYGFDGVSAQSADVTGGESMAWSAFEPLDAQTFPDGKYSSRTGTEEQFCSP